VPEASGGTGQASKVAIAVLTWNGYATTRACLDSLRRLNEWPVPVAVVDNGSREPEGERLAAELGSPVIAVRLDPNQGVPGGYNAGLKWAAANGFSHVLLMNNDTLVTDPEMLSRLVAAAAAADVAAVTPITLNPDGSVYSAGGSLSWVTGLSGHIRTPKRSDGAYRMTWLDGPCLLVSLDAARIIGGLEETFVTYWEDLDWCVRASRSGFQCLVEPRTSIVHLRGGTTTSNRAESMDLRNGILFIRRNGTLLQNLTVLAFFVFVRVPIFLVRRGRSTARLHAAMGSVTDALGWNIRDAVANRSWRRPALARANDPG
jgi:GT2 family glycosyltransferase